MLFEFPPFTSSLDWQQTVPFWQLFVLGMMVHTADIICGIHTPGQFLTEGGGLRLGGPSLGSNFFVMQHLPSPGHLILRSISSHSRVKNPETQVPRHELELLGGETDGLGVVLTALGVVSLTTFESGEGFGGGWPSLG